MSKKKSPDVPVAPVHDSVPVVADSYNSLYKYGTGIADNFSGLGPMMMDTINLNPDISRLATQQYVSAQEPAYRRGLQDITNTLEANNQLTGSTTGNTLQNYQNDYLAGLTSANAGIAIADINRALSNRVNLYSTGLNAIQAAGSLGMSDQTERNNFALQNYENQVAQAMMSQPQQNSGFWSTLGGIAGAGIGSLFPGGTMIGAGLGSALGAGFSGGDPSGGLSSAGSAFGFNKLSGALNGILTSSGAGSKRESISSSLSNNPWGYNAPSSFGNYYTY